MGIIQSAADIEALAQTVPDSAGVTFVPALAGLGAPHWNPDARGLLCGITGGTNQGHVARAVLDGIALEIGDILRAMSRDLGGPLTELRVDGGAARNDLLMQIQSDVIATRCVRPKQLETTALGSGFLAGLAVGMWSSPDAVQEAWAQDAVFEPQVTQQDLEETLARWASAVSRA